MPRVRFKIATLMMLVAVCGLADFRIKSTAPLPWFSHQHDARYINDTTLVLFDDGNTRRSRHPGETSRGQELILDERSADRINRSRR